MQSEFISAEKIVSVLTYKLLVDAVERGLGLFSQSNAEDVADNSTVDQPVRTVVNISNNGFLGCMPVYVEADQLLVTKLVTFFPKNKDVPTHNAIIVVFSANTGVPRAILDGDVITTRRTAAASVVATKHLANGNPRVLAILGCGVQASSHYEAFSDTFQLEQVRVWNHKPERAQEFARSREHSHNCVACDSAQDAVRDADVVVIVTSSNTPVLMAEWIKPGAHINGVGACRPDWAEIDPALMKSAVVYVDSREGALKESGDIILSGAKIFAEIGEVVNGTKSAKRDKTTVFKSLGMAVEDAVAAKIVLDEFGL
ncbi:hypothetical protein EGW08_011169 [Elysia chlorotica]|uniref:Ketimine reductase mu-crystallin n=1 Tax=Elysia chlorotica TaxID=188477 RepID=A0A3S1A2L8_ELYCH|nr:hypothetical protein EGW08_011169 [Elysia chlorotica]